MAADLATQNERLKMNNPTKNGACNWDRRVKTAWKVFPEKENLGAMLGMRVVSTPNGMSYGSEGFVPCDHVLRVDYERGRYEFNGTHSKVTLA